MSINGNIKTISPDRMVGEEGDSAGVEQLSFIFSTKARDSFLPLQMEREEVER